MSTGIQTSSTARHGRLSGALVAVGIGLAATSKRIRGWRRDAGETRRLGPYVLHEKLGEGAMGEVYRASHPRLDRPVAIKVLSPARHSAENAARFELEAEMTSRLGHPNTVRVLDRGRAADGTPYYAMECLDGATLSDVVAEQGPMPAERAIHVLDQIAAALEEAHAAGLVHRDIKPANVFLTHAAGAHDVVKVLDFGLVAQVGVAGASDATVPALSHGDRLAGTPLYMAPEAIATPDRVDGRTDLYALGAVGYFLLTGQDVFTGRSVPEVCAHHLHSVPVPPSRRLGAPVPAALEALILSCLEKDPARRPASASSLRAGLRAALCPALCPADACDSGSFALAA